MRPNFYTRKKTCYGKTAQKSNVPEGKLKKVFLSAQENFFWFVNGTDAILWHKIESPEECMNFVKAGKFLPKVHQKIPKSNDA